MLSETAAVLAKIAYLSDEPAWKLLEEVLLPLHDLRVGAYARLNDALRRSASNAAAKSVLADEYPTVCANCTEDFKVASEGIIGLRDVLQTRKHEDGMTDVVAVLDRLQAMEEQKLVLVVSLHALKRSASAEPVDLCDGDHHENVEQKVARFSQNLQKLDYDLGDVMDEIRETIADGAEGSNFPD